MIQLPWKEEENPVAVTDDVAISLSLTDFAVGTYQGRYRNSPIQNREDGSF